MDRNVESFIRRARIGVWAALALLPGRPVGAAPSDLPPAPPPRAAPAALPAAATPVAGVKFSFDQADIRLIIRLAGEVTGRRFVVDEKVAGTVTVIASRASPPASASMPRRTLPDFAGANGYFTACVP